MYQMMQMHEAALVQYKELGAIVSYAPSSLLSSSEWPMVAGESLESSDSISSKDSNLQALEKLCQGENDSTDHDKSLALSSGNEFFSSKVREKRDEVSDKMSVVSLKQVERKLEMKDCLSDAYRNGDDILAYSINIARMKILRCKLNFLEVHRYIFAREMYFLLALQRPVDFARKAMDYLSNTFHAAMKNICSKHSDSSKTYVVRIKQAELWLIACTLKIVRAGRDLLNRGHPVEAPNILNAFSEKYSSSIGLPVALNNDHTFISTSQILVELLSCTLSKLNHLSPTISTVARSEISLAIERTLLNLTDDSVEIFPQSGQFLSQIVVAEKSISDVLEKELSAADFGLQGSVDKVSIYYFLVFS